MTKIYAMVGKGGVGKTTLAVELACEIKKKTDSVCIIGLDRQHNAADVLKEKNVQIDYHGLFQFDKIGEMAGFIIDNTFLKGYREFIPIVAPDFLTICALSECFHEFYGKYEYIVIDFPPNHAALYMLNLPNVLNSIIYKALTLKGRIKKMVKGNDGVMDNIEHLEIIIKEFKTHLAEINFCPIMTPTSLSFLECKKLIDFLGEQKLKTLCVILNMMPIFQAGCPSCGSRQYHSKPVIDELVDYTKNMNLRLCGVIEHHISGLHQLLEW